MVEFKNEFLNRKMWPFCCGFFKSLLYAFIIFTPALILSLPKLLNEKIFFVEFSFAVSLIYSFGFLSSAIFYKYTEDANKLYSSMVEITTLFLALLILLTSFNDDIELPLIKYGVLAISIILMWLSYSFTEYDKRNPKSAQIKQNIDKNEKQRQKELSEGIDKLIQ